MFSRFFIERPVFSWVIAIVIMLAGALSILRLPISQFPQIAPPQVSISATYPGRLRRDDRKHRHADHRAEPHRS